MLTTAQHRQAQLDACSYFEQCGVRLRPDEIATLEVADFGLGRLSEIGLQLVTYVNTERCCAKELALMPRQTCPEHRHPPVGHYAGKEETFRCRWGRVFLYVDGEPTSAPRARLPVRDRAYFTVWHEIVLEPGHQWTIPPNTLHWFQADDAGTVVSEFSTKSMDEHDVFTNPEIQRKTIIHRAEDAK